MDADYSFYVKSIATYAPAFLRDNNSVLARVLYELYNECFIEQYVLIFCLIDEIINYVFS